MVELVSLKNPFVLFKSKIPQIIVLFIPFIIFFKNYSQENIRTLTLHNKTSTTINICGTTLSPVNFLKTHDALLGNPIVLEPDMNQEYKLDNRSKSIAIAKTNSFKCWTLPIPQSNKATVFFLPIEEFALAEGEEE